MTQRSSIWTKTIHLRNIAIPVLWLCLAGAIAGLAYMEVENRNQVLTTIGLFVLVVFCLGALFGVIRQIRIIHRIILVGLTLDVLCGLLLLFNLTVIRSGTTLYHTFSDVAMTLPPIVSVMVIVAMIVSNLPGFLFGLFVLYMACIVLFPASGIVSMQWHSTDIYLPQQYQISNNVIFLFLILFGLAYFPRDLQWKRYFWPQSMMRPYDPPQRREQGFTLIELLIVVAILSIVVTGAMQAWVQGIHNQHALEQRMTISRILSSEMDAIAGLKTLPSMGGDPQPLPIPLDSFPAPKDLQGEYLWEATETPGLVKVTVQLHHGLRPEEQQHYRLIALRRGES